jgi:hypothetical protein
MAPSAGAFGPPRLNGFFDKLQLGDQVFADIAITDPERFGTTLHRGLFFGIKIFPGFKNAAKGR